MESPLYYWRDQHGHEIVLLVYRNLEEMMKDRGLEVEHTSIETKRCRSCYWSIPSLVWVPPDS